MSAAAMIPGPKNRPNRGSLSPAVTLSQNTPQPAARRSLIRNRLWRRLDLRGIRADRRAHIWI